MLKRDTTVGKLPVAIGTVLEERTTGNYYLDYNIEDNVAYTVKLTNGVDTLNYGNICQAKYADAVITVLNRKICKNAPPITLTVSANPALLSTEFFDVDKVTKRRVVVTQFNPSIFNAGDTIFVKVDIVPGDVKACPFTIVQPVVITTQNCDKGSLDDFVWKNTNSNGIQDETTLNGGGGAGVQVELYKVDTTAAIAKDTTDASGKYLFTNLNAGQFYVKVLAATLPTGCEISSVKDVLSDDAKDSDVDPSTGQSHRFEFQTCRNSRDDGYVLCSIDGGKC